MSEQRLWVTGPMPGMNQILDFKSRTMGGFRKHSGPKWNMYAQEKREWSEKINAAAVRQKLQPSQASYITFFILEPNKRRDPDNFTFGAVKFILDALVNGKYLEGDGWKSILGFTSYWDVSDLPGVAVFIRDDRLLTREECAMGQREVDLG